MNDARDVLLGAALKLCTFKVGETVRGRKVGELFLKAAFRYATENNCENIFITAHPERQDFLICLLKDFGFEEHGGYQSDTVLIKQHPKTPPPENGIEPVEYLRTFFPHYRSDSAVSKFLVPIRPSYHKILFPDCQRQRELFPSGGQTGHVGNAIKLAYLCHAQINSIQPGSILLFYRTKDAMAVTSLGVVEQFQASDNGAQIAGLVSRRTVYSIEEIEDLSKKTTKVILFRLVAHLPKFVSYDRLKNDGVITGPIQSICKVSDVAFAKVLFAARQ